MLVQGTAYTLIHAIHPGVTAHVFLRKGRLISGEQREPNRYRIAFVQHFTVMHCPIENGRHRSRGSTKEDSSTNRVKAAKRSKKRQSNALYIHASICRCRRRPARRNAAGAHRQQPQNGSSSVEISACKIRHSAKPNKDDSRSLSGGWPNLATSLLRPIILTLSLSHIIPGTQRGV